MGARSRRQGDGGGGGSGGGGGDGDGRWNAGGGNGCGDSVCGALGNGMKVWGMVVVQVFVVCGCMVRSDKILLLLSQKGPW